MGNYLKLAWRNSWRNWRRTTIAIVAIVLGLILLLFFDGFLKGSDQAIFGNSVRMFGGNIQAHSPGFREKASRLPLIPLEDADAVVQAATAQPQVVAAAKRISTSGLVSSREGAFPVAITGIEPSIEAPLSIQAENVDQGRFLMDEDGDAIFIGQGLADLLNVSVGDRVKLMGRAKNEKMRQHTMTIVGVYDLGMSSLEKGMVFIPLPTAQNLYNLRDEVTEVTISLDTVGEEAAVISALKATLSGYEIDSWDTLRPEMQEMLRTKLAFTSAIGLIVILIASIGILNIQLMAAFERTREIGVLAAMGMKGRQIMNVFLLEGVSIGAVGASVGCVLSILLLGVLSNVGIGFGFAADISEVTALLGDRIYPSVTARDIISRGVTVVIIVAIASLYPAWQAARKEPAEALHHV
jgi:ABC-type lipoprotein release transport system permease subunit